MGKVIADLAASAASATFNVENATSSVNYVLSKTDGAAGEFLKTDGSGALSFAEAGGGKVLQVKQTSLNTTVSSTSTTYVASGLTLTMTGIASTDSKFLLSVDGGQMSTSNNTYECLCTFFVDTGSGAAEVSDAGPYELMKKYDNVVPHSALYLHAPSTTSDTTYSVHYKINSSPGGQTAIFNTATARVTFTVTELSS